MCSVERMVRYEARVETWRGLNGEWFAVADRQPLRGVGESQASAVGHLLESLEFLLDLPVDLRVVKGV